MRSAVVLWGAIRVENADPAELARVALAIELGCRGRVESHYEFDRKQRNCTWSRSPRDLIAAIWLQFAGAVVGDKQYSQCPAPRCGKWYELSQAAKGPDWNYCSDACKLRAHRHRLEQRRKGEAQELFKKGWPVEQIAKELKMPAKTVKQWVAEAPQDESAGAKGTRPGIDL